MKKLSITGLMLVLFTIILGQTNAVSDSTGLGDIFAGLDFSVLGIVAIVLTVIFGVLALIYGKKYTTVKGLIEELILVIADSIKDNKIATQELNNILALVRKIKQTLHQ